MRKTYIVVCAVVALLCVNANAAAKTPVPSSCPYIEYTVQKGDTLWLLAQRYNTSAREIMECTGIKFTDLRVAQILKIPVAAEDTFAFYKHKVGRPIEPLTDGESIKKVPEQAPGLFL